MKYMVATHGFDYKGLSMKGKVDCLNDCPIGNWC